MLRRADDTRLQRTVTRRHGRGARPIALCTCAARHKAARRAFRLPVRVGREPVRAGDVVPGRGRAVGAPARAACRE